MAGVLALTVLTYVGAAQADPIGTPTNPCANGSCNGSIYTLTTDFVNLDGGSGAFDIFDITLTIDTSGFNAGPGFLTDASIMVTSNLISGTLLASPGNGFTEVSGGINNSGCNGSGAGFDCAEEPGGPSLAPVPNGIYTFIFRETIGEGTLFTLPGAASVKARYADGSDDRIGAITSEPITLQNSNPPLVPEPSTLLLLGSGLVGLGLLGRKRYGENYKN